jgi:hypothetical protein
VATIQRDAGARPPSPQRTGTGNRVRESRPTGTQRGRGRGGGTWAGVGGGRRPAIDDDHSLLAAGEFVHLLQTTHHMHHVQNATDMNADRGRVQGRMIGPQIGRKTGRRTDRHPIHELRNRDVDGRRRMALPPSSQRQHTRTVTIRRCSVSAAHWSQGCCLRTSRLLVVPVLL